MSTPTARIEVEEWRPSPVPLRLPEMRVPAALRRSLTMLLVVGLHALVAVQFALPALQVGRSRQSAAPPVMLANFVEAQSAAAASPPSDVIPQEIPPSLAAPAPTQWPDISVDEADVEAEPNNEFAPPRLRESAALEPGKYALRAGLAIVKAARVILTVTVTERGIAGDVAVAISSGDSKLDSLAIEYVRALRWEPAIVQGRQSSMNIRLPVVFAAPGQH